jgi:hypothetical protein
MNLTAVRYLTEWLHVVHDVYFGCQIEFIMQKNKT